MPKAETVRKTPVALLFILCALTVGIVLWRQVKPPTTSPTMVSTLSPTPQASLTPTNSPMVSPTITPDPLVERTMYIAELFNDDREIRVQALAALTRWRSDPLLIPLIVEKAMADRKNVSGVYMALLVLERQDQKNLQQNRDSILELLDVTKRSGPDTITLANKLRDILSSPTG